MHELSIINNLVEQADKIAQENGADSVSKIIIEVGERSGVDCALLTSTFETFKIESKFCKNAFFEIKRQPVVLACGACGAEFEAQGLEYAKCKKCASDDVKIIKGRELLLLSLELEFDDNKG